MRCRCRCISRFTVKRSLRWQYRAHYGGHCFSFIPASGPAHADATGVGFVTGWKRRAPRLIMTAADADVRGRAWTLPMLGLLSSAFRAHAGGSPHGRPPMRTAALTAGTRGFLAELASKCRPAARRSRFFIAAFRRVGSELAPVIAMRWSALPRLFSWRADGQLDDITRRRSYSPRLHMGLAPIAILSAARLA